MTKGRPANLDLISAEEREKLRVLAGGDSSKHRRLLMQALRAAKKRQEVKALAAVGDPQAPAGQLHFAGEEFDLAEFDKAHKEELRERCKRDLFFLCTEVLGRDLTERTHRPVCDFLGNPDPHLPLEAQLDVIRERIWLDPRGTFKTSIANDVAVQWIICFPEVRILFLGGEKMLAAASLDTCTETFVIRGDPTRFQRLFPEFCISPGEKYERKFVAPNRRNLKRHKEPTAWSNSVDSALSGWHPDIIISDDVVNDENAQTIERVGKVKRVFYQALQLLEPICGRLFYIDTRYHPSDLSGELISQTSAKRQVLVRAALWAKPELGAARCRELEAALRDPNVASADLDVNDWELLFPERLTFANLMAERGPSLEKFEVFGSQKLNDPIVASGLATFTMERMREATVPAGVIPHRGQVFIYWDLAYSVKRGRDFSVGVAGLIDSSQRAWILEIQRGRFVTHELVYHIVDMHRRWAPQLTGIEDSVGARWLLSDLDRMALDLGVPLKLDWFPVDTSDRAKDGRVKSQEALLHQKRLFFSAGIACIDDVYKEYCGYGSEAHDDIPDCVGQLVARHVKMLVENEETLGMTEEQLAQEERRSELHDMIYRTGHYTPREQEPPPAPDPYQLEDAMPGLNG